MTVVGRRRFTSGHRMGGGQEEDQINHGRTKRQTLCEAETWKKLWHFVRLRRVITVEFRTFSKPLFCSYCPCEARVSNGVDHVRYNC